MVGSALPRVTQAQRERRAPTAHPPLSHFLCISLARPPQTAPWVTVMTSTIEGAGTSLEESAATMTVRGKEMKDVEGTIGMTESGTVVGSAAVEVNIVTMTAIGGSASLLPGMSSAPRRSA